MSRICFDRAAPCARWLGHFSITILPAAFLTAIEILSLCTSMPIYLVLLVIKGCSFLDGLRQAPKPYSKRGTLLYCVGKPERFRPIAGSGMTYSKRAAKSFGANGKVAERGF